MKKQKKNMGAGLTGYSMRVGRDRSVRVVRGTMYKLLNARKGSILTRILSLHFVHRSLRSLLYARRKRRQADNRGKSYPRTYGLIGLQTAYAHPNWANSTTLRELRQLRAQAGMRLNTYSKPEFSRVIGLQDGSAFRIITLVPITQ